MANRPLRIPQINGTILIFLQQNLLKHIDISKLSVALNLASHLQTMEASMTLGPRGNRSILYIETTLRILFCVNPVTKDYYTSMGESKYSITYSVIYSLYMERHYCIIWFITPGGSIRTWGPGVQEA